MTEQEYAARNETVVEHLDHTATRGSIEVEHHVSAEDDIAPADEMRALLIEEVHLRKMAERARGRSDPEAAGGRRAPRRQIAATRTFPTWHRHEPPRPHGVRHRAERSGPIDTASRC